MKWLRRLRSSWSRFPRPRSPWLAASAVVALGGILGALSAGHQTETRPPDQARPSTSHPEPQPSCPASTLEDNGVCTPVGTSPIETLPLLTHPESTPPAAP